MFIFRYLLFVLILPFNYSCTGAVKDFFTFSNKEVATSYPANKIQRKRKSSKKIKNFLEISSENKQETLLFYQEIASFLDVNNVEKLEQTINKNPQFDVHFSSEEYKKSFLVRTLESKNPAMIDLAINHHSFNTQTLEILYKETSDSIVEQFYTPLMLGTVYKNGKLIKTCIDDPEVDVNSTDENIQGAIFHAIKSDNVEALLYLIFDDRFNLNLKAVKDINNHNIYKYAVSRFIKTKRQTKEQKMIIAILDVLFTRG